MRRYLKPPLDIPLTGEKGLNPEWKEFFEDTSEPEEVTSDLQAKQAMAAAQEVGDLVVAGYTQSRQQTASTATDIRQMKEDILSLQDAIYVVQEQIALIYSEIETLKVRKLDSLSDVEFEGMPLFPNCGLKWDGTNWVVHTFTEGQDV
jgi:hypothetical protein